MPTAEIILAILQTIRIGAGVIERYQRGELTDEQLADEWSAMQANVTALDNLWKEAGGEEA